MINGLKLKLSEIQCDVLKKQIETDHMIIYKVKNMEQNKTGEEIAIQSKAFTLFR